MKEVTRMTHVDNTAEGLTEQEWATRLQFDPADFGVNVAAGTVNGKRIGIASAMFCAILRHERESDLAARPLREHCLGAHAVEQDVVVQDDL
jgi:hypothetical protein